MTSQRRQSSEDPSEDVSVRCLQIVEHTYRKGVASLDELARLTGADARTIAGDVALLHRGGLSIDVDGEGRCRVNQEIPGFGLRLTTAEAAAAWVIRWYCRDCRSPLRVPVPAEMMSAACAILESGLRKYHPGSEETCHRPADHLRLGRAAFQRRMDGERQADFSGEAKRLCKRLRILDLVESGKARRRDQLTALLGMSDRTIGTDLRLLRRAGLKIAYLHRSRTYRVDGMHAYFARRLSSPNGAAHAAALLVLFGSGEDGDRDEAPLRWVGQASRKIVHGIRLVFKGREGELDAVMASYAGRP